MEAIKALLCGDANKIEDIIRSYGFSNVHSNSKRVMFAFDDDSKGSCQVDINSLSYVRWSDDTHGSLINAIMSKTGMYFKDAIIDLKNKLGISNQTIHIKKREDNCIFKDLNDKLHLIVGDNVYSDLDIKKYKPIISKMFRDDGINIATQCEFDIRYDEESDRVVILWRNIKGEIVGNTARANWKISKDYKYKYISLLPFNKREHLFGLYENKEYIKNAGYCVLVEAEKSTLQAHSFGFRPICSVGMSHIDKCQIKLLYDLGIRCVILAYDEDKHIIEYIKRSNDIKSWFPDMEIYAIYDKDKKYLPLDSKNSPTDMGEEMFKKLFENCMQKI